MTGLKNVVLIPTYNEKENIQGLLVTLTSVYPDLEIWVIDDNSPDGTAAIVDAFSKSNPKVRLISRTAKNGLGEAYKHALRMIQKLPDVGVVVTMDADGSHDYLKIRELIDALQKYDLAIGSRYVSGGGGMKTSVHRNFLSQGGNFYSRLIIGSGIRDSTAGFVAFRKSAIDGIDLSSIASSGYSYQIEFKHKLLEIGKTFVEVPITFLDRIRGHSKMSGNIVVEGMITPWRIALRRITNRSRFFKIVLTALAIFFFAFASFFSTYKLTESPSVWYDEGIYTELGRNIALNGVSGIRLAPTEIARISALTVGYPLTYPLAVVFKIWGYSIAHARLVMVTFLLGFVLVSYFLIKRLYGSVIALASLALLATFGPLYGNGKSVLGEVPGLFFIALALLFLDTFSSVSGSKRYVYMVCAGLFTGLAAATKPYFLIFPVAVFLSILISRKDIFLKWKEMVLGVIAGLVPIATWMILQFEYADSATGTLSRYANPNQFGNVASIVIRNINSFFTGLGPLYLLGMTLVWILALWLRRRNGIRTSVAEIAAFIFSMISIVAFLRTSGMYRYIFPAQAMSVIFFASSLVSVLYIIRGSLPGFLARQRNKIVLGVVACMTLFGAYQVGFDSWVAEAYDSHKTADWQAYFANMSSSTTVFFYNTPEVAIYKNDSNYYQYFEPAPEMRIGTEYLDILQKGIPNQVIIQTEMMKRVDPVLIATYKSSELFYKYSILRK